MPRTGLLRSVELETPLEVYADVPDLGSARGVLVVVYSLNAGLVVELQLHAGAEVARLGDAGRGAQPHVVGDALADQELRLGAVAALRVGAGDLEVVDLRHRLVHLALDA